MCDRLNELFSLSWRSTQSIYTTSRPKECCLSDTMNRLNEWRLLSWKVPNAVSLIIYQFDISHPYRSPIFHRSTVPPWVPHTAHETFSSLSRTDPCCLEQTQPIHIARLPPVSTKQLRVWLWCRHGRRGHTSTSSRPSQVLFTRCLPRYLSLIVHPPPQVLQNHRIIDLSDQAMQPTHDMNIIIVNNFCSQILL